MIVRVRIGMSRKSEFVVVLIGFLTMGLAMAQDENEVSETAVEALSDVVPAVFEEPTKATEERFKSLAARSLFGIPTEEPKQVETTTPFLQRYQLLSASRFDGVDYVTIQDREQNKSLRINSGEGGEPGWELVRIDWSEDLKETRVQLEKGSEGGVLTFDPKQLFQSGPPPAAPNVAARGAAPRVTPPPLPPSVRRRVGKDDGPAVQRRQIRRRIIRPPSGASDSQNNRPG